VKLIELAVKKKCLVAIAMFLIVLSANVFSGRQLAQTTEDEYVRKRIAEIINQTANHAVNVKGVKVWTRMPPTKEFVTEIKKFGDNAIPILVEYLSNEDTRTRIQAIEFLGLLKNNKAIEPLKEIVLKDASPTLRIISLRWLSELPWDSISGVIQQATTDSDDNVRATALSLIKHHARDE
jgi:hypothetical protein